MGLAKQNALDLIIQTKEGNARNSQAETQDHHLLFCGMIIIFFSAA
jgi:hypothetical protein